MEKDELYMSTEFDFVRTISIEQVTLVLLLVLLRLTRTHYIRNKLAGYHPILTSGVIDPTGNHIRVRSSHCSIEIL
jgi:hypothetical protein